MKKWLIALCLVLAAGAVAAAVAGYKLNSKYGWMASPAVYHDTLATPDTRFRVAADTVRLGRDLKPYLPHDISLPVWLPWDIHALLPKILPREIALLGGSDFRDGRYNLTLFVNEQRGGPTLPVYLNTRTQILRQFSGVTWEDPGFELEDRGILRARGHMELPIDLETIIRETWSPQPIDGALLLSGGHLAEGVIDNRDGEIVTLVGTLAPIWGTSLEQLRKNPQVEAALALLAGVLDLRAAVDFKSVDALVVQVRISAKPEVGGQLEFLLSLVVPMMAKQVQQRYGLVMSSESRWDEEESSYFSEITLTGVEEKLKGYFKQVIPARAPAPAAS